MPAKPHNWGIKLFVLCGPSGNSYGFEVYTGQEDDPSGRSDEPDLGASSNVVMRLSRKIPRNVGYKLYFDNYYSYFFEFGSVACKTRNIFSGHCTA